MLLYQVDKVDGKNPAFSYNCITWLNILKVTANGLKKGGDRIFLEG